MATLPLPPWATALVEVGALTQSQLVEVAKLAEVEGEALAEVIAKSAGVPEEMIAAHIAMDMQVPFVDPRMHEIQLDNASLVPEDIARKHRLFPLFEVEDTITLGMVDPTDLAIIDHIRLRLRRQVEPCLCPASTITSIIDRAYSATRMTEADRVSAPPSSPTGPGVTRSAGKIVQMVQELLDDAARTGASDVHIEPDPDQLRIRCRIDGILHERAIHATEIHPQVVSRIKVEAGMDIAETRRPQDGHFSTTANGTDIDIRVSTTPTVYGENVVLRLLQSDEDAAAIDEIGMPDEVVERVTRALDDPNGMILVTGPTGSGKTTTLYAALSRLATPERNVVTVEDPVEKRLPMLRQTQVNNKAGVTFAVGLRSFLRQDPDVIMVGEIRDRETAEITVQAALTGHLVLSTLHTNSAAGAVVRLSEMGIAPFLLTSSLRVVLSQRLARRICTECREPTTPDPGLAAGLGFDPSEEVAFMRGAGCARCMNTGYKGRVAIYELLEMTAGLSKALLSGSSRDLIEREATKGLICSLREDGLNRVRQGITTVEEVVRVAGIHDTAASG